MLRVKDALTTGQVAAICNVAPRTVTKWFDSGRLKGYRIPGSRDRRIPRSELKKFMREYNIPDTMPIEVGGIGLLVSDDVTLAQAMNSGLAGKWEVRTANSGFEAGLAIQRYQPDVVFVSLLSSTIDAYAICQSIKQNAELANITVIALAESLTDSEQAAIRQKGFDGWLSMSNIKSAAVRDLEQILISRS